MPDISMCGVSNCPLSKKCYRHPDSGTVPTEYRQAWFLGMEETGEKCDYFWPIRETKDKEKEKD